MTARKWKRGNPTSSKTWVEETGEGCVITAASYDRLGRQVSATDPLGQVSTTAYVDGGGQTTPGWPTRVVTTTPGTDGGAGWTSSVSPRRSDGAPSASVDANGRTTGFGYDSLGRVTSVSVPGSPKQYVFAYHDTVNGQQVLQAAAWTQTTTKLTPDQTVSSASFTDGFARGRQSQSLSPAGGRVVADTRFDAQGLPGLVVPGVNVAGGFGLWTGDASAAPSRSITAFDGLGRATSSSTTAGGKTVVSSSTVYGGDTVTSSTPGVGDVVVSSDAYDRPVSRVAYTGAGTAGTRTTTAYKWDDLDRLVGMSGPGGRVWSWSYDQAGRRLTATDPDAGTTSTVWRKDSQPETVTTPAGRVWFGYDDRGRVTNTRVNSASGDVLSKTDWDAPGHNGVQASSTTYSRGVGSQSLSTSWDDADRPLDTQWLIPADLPDAGALAGTVVQESYEYNLAGDLTRVGYSAAAGLPAETIEVDYTSLGAPDKLTVDGSVLVAGTGYDALGRLAARTWASGSSGNALVRRVGYNEGLGAPDHVTSTVNDASGAVLSTIQDDTYSFDKAARPTVVADAVSGRSQCFTYDGLNRLTAARTATGCAGAARETRGKNPAGENPAGRAPAKASPGGSPVGSPTPGEVSSGEVTSGEYNDAWTFTDAGRVASRTHSDTSAGSDPVSYTYTYGDTARPDAVTGLSPSTGEASSYTYTSSGQRATTTTGSDTQTTSWDVTGQPTSLTTPSGVMSYWYGADGLFATTSATAGSVIFAGATQLSFKDGAVSGRRSYTLGGATTGFRDTAVDASVVSPAANDVQGSATIQTDPAALSAAAGWVKHTYTPYGSALATTGAQAWSGINGWLNKPTLPGAGLSQVGARQYDPVLQQFTSPDPLIDPSQPGGFNPYTYAGNNPTTYSDPSGLSWMSPRALRRIMAVVSAGAASVAARNPSPISSSIGVSGTANVAVAEPVVPEGQGFSRCAGVSYCVDLEPAEANAVWDGTVNVIAEVVGVNDAKRCSNGEGVGYCALVATIIIPGVGKLVGKGIQLLGKLAGKGIDAVRAWRATRAADDAADAARAGAKTLDEFANVDFRSNTSHIFRDAAGHLAKDTAENRALIQSALDQANLRTTITLKDGSTLAKYYKTLPDGTQAWAEVRNGTEITNGGLNVMPR